MEGGKGLADGGEMIIYLFSRRIRREVRDAREGGRLFLQTAYGFNAGVPLSAVTMFQLVDLVRVVICFDGFNLPDDLISHSSESVRARVVCPVSLADESFNTRGHPRGVRRVDYTILGGEVVVEGFRGGGDKVHPLCVDVLYFKYLGPWVVRYPLPKLPYS